MTSGNRAADSIPTFPDDCHQSMVGTWWERDESPDLCVGRLVLAAVPHVDQIPKMITPTGRREATVHDTATFKVEAFSMKNYNAHSKLPVAGMPAYEREVNIVQRAKRRPCIVVGLCGEEIPKSMNPGKPGWQTASTRLIAPYYGVDEGGGNRAGWAAPFVRRIRACQYAQFMWDRIPLDGASESILRLDQIQAIGRHHQSTQLLPWRWSAAAVSLLDEWLQWLRHNAVESDSLLELVLSSVQDACGVVE